MGPAPSFFFDVDFLNAYVRLLATDVETLKVSAHLVTPDDFKPRAGQAHGRSRWIVATCCLEYYGKYHQAAGKLLNSEIQHYGGSIGLADRQIHECLEYSKLLTKLDTTNPNAILGKIVAFKRDLLKTQAIEELIELKSSGELTDAKLLEISRRAIQLVSEDVLPTTAYFETLEDRIHRRSHEDVLRYPLLGIDPLDRLVRGIGPGHVGLIIGPLKRGKTMMLQRITTSYVWQKMNVLYITLEDPLADVEDRLDASITSLPIHKLASLPKTLRERFTRFQRIAKQRLRLVDGTGGGITTERLEQIWLDHRDQGFRADAYIIDYDDEITPTTKNKDRRFEFADIYRDIRRIAGDHKIILWTAAQTQRDTSRMKVLTSDELAEDISKARKVTMAISLGQGDWGPDSYYLYVAAHRNDVQHVGVNIMSDKSRMLIYDPDATQEKEREEQSDADGGE
jgi:archaellum biogenesis ATPase FlaH